MHSWTYIGWLNKPQYTGANYPKGFVVLSSFDSVYKRITNINSTSGLTTLSTANNAITNPLFSCETGFTCPVTTPDYSSIILRDDASPNQPVGELYHHIDVPSSYANGKIVFDQNSQAYIVCGAWGGAKKAMKCKATGYALPT